MSNYEYSILPEYAPLYPKLPYEYKDYQKVSVYCRGDKEALQKYLPKEFTLVSEIFEVFILQNNEIEGLELYSEGGIVIPCSYEGITGACVAYEYVDTDDALCAGREIWGYPKKMADVQFEHTGNSVNASLGRKGTKLIDIAFEEADIGDFKVPTLSPRIQVKRMPHPEKNDTDMNVVVKNELQNVVAKKKTNGKATITLGDSLSDPLNQLGVKEIVGATYLEGAFTLTYGEIVKDLNDKKLGGWLNG